MKVTVISISAFFFCQICYAQNVGIGTATPTQKLEVAGTTKTTGLLMTPGAGTGKIMESDSVGNASWQKPEIIKLASAFPCNQLADSVITGSEPFSVAISGNYAYVVNRLSYTMTVYDISNDTISNELASVSTGPEPTGIDVSGSYAYVVNSLSNTMRIYDVSNPLIPVQIASVPTGNRPWSVTVHGIYAYVVNALGYSMSVFDISSPAFPSLAGSVNTLPNPWKVAVSGNYAYLVNNTGFMTVYDVSDPSNINQVASVSADSNYPSGSGPYFITISNNFAYVVNVDVHTMSIFNITNPLNPIQLSSTATGDHPYSVAVKDNYAYVTNWTGNSVSIFNIASAANPIKTITINTGIKPTSVALSGNYAYVTNQVSNKLQKFYIGNCSVNLNIINGTISLSPATWTSLNNNIYNSNSGNVGIGTSAPTALLSVNGTANKPGGGTWATFSDMRLKDQVLPFKDGLATLLQIKPVKFHYNELSGFGTRPEYVGLLAQELQSVAPYMLSTIKKNGIDYLSLDNGPITYILINSIKEQQLQIEELKKQNETLRTKTESRIAELELKLNALLNSK